MIALYSGSELCRVSDIGSIPGHSSVLLNTILCPFYRATKYKRVANAAKTIAHSKCGPSNLLENRMLPTHKLVQIVKARWNQKRVPVVLSSLVKVARKRSADR